MAKARVQGRVKVEKEIKEERVPRVPEERGHSVLGEGAHSAVEEVKAEVGAEVRTALLGSIVCARALERACLSVCLL